MHFVLKFTDNAFKKAFQEEFGFVAGRVSKAEEKVEGMLLDKGATNICNLKHAQYWSFEMDGLGQLRDLRTALLNTGYVEEIKRFDPTSGPTPIRRRNSGSKG